MQLGDRIGKIRIVDQLGEGGMGQVFVGFDERLERKVAVKVIGGHRRLNVEAKERFIREARLLSKLEHPNICRIYDLIEDDECDYIILELIKGRDLSEVAEDMTWNTKLRVAQEIAAVLHEAHKRNIVHRDLKPDNVMITEEGHVKVLDFGLARSTGDVSPVTYSASGHGESISVDLGSRVVTAPVPEAVDGGGFSTGCGTILGTPMFMSPEQARGEPVNASSDMYSFGLLLHWLFTGQPPYPSGVFGTGLIVLVMKGETEPVKGIDADVASLINQLKSVAPEDRPIAKDALDRLLYIGRKPLRRLKILGLTVFSVVLIAGTVLSTIGFVKARQSERRALEGEANAKQTLDLMKEFLSSVNPSEKGRDLKVIDLLEAFAARLDEYNHKPLIQASLYEAYASTYGGLGLWEESFSCALKSFELRRKELGEKHPDTLTVQHTLARVLWFMGRYEEAEAQLRDVSAKNRLTFGEDHPATLQSTGELSRTLRALARYAEAEKLCRETVENMKNVQGRDHATTLEFMRVLGNIQWDRGRFHEAEIIQRQVWEVRNEKLGPEHPQSLMSVFYLALAIREQGRFEEAENLLRDLVEQFERVLGPRHMATPFAKSNLGYALANLKKFEEAETLCRQALDSLVQLLGPDNANSAVASWYLGEVLMMQGKYEESEKRIKSALVAYNRVFSEEHPYSLLAKGSLAENLWRQGLRDEARSLLEDLAQKWNRTLGRDHPWAQRLLAFKTQIEVETNSKSSHEKPE